MQWYLKALRRYADFAGRARRTEYWMFTLINTATSIVLSFADLGLGLLVGGGLGVLSTVYSLAVLVPSVAVAARRLHDTGRSGWWQVAPAAPIVLVFALIPFVGSARSFGTGEAPFIALLFVAMGMAVVLTVWMATDGTPGPNRFGPNPKEPVPGPMPQSW